MNSTILGQGRGMRRFRNLTFLVEEKIPYYYIRIIMKIPHMFIEGILCPRYLSTGDRTMNNRVWDPFLRMSTSLLLRRGLKLMHEQGNSRSNNFHEEKKTKRVYAWWVKLIE